MLFIVAIMTPRNASIHRSMDRHSLEETFQSLQFRLADNGAEPVGLVVCGGSALIVMGLVSRTTKDVDVLALRQEEVLVSPAPLPRSLIQAVGEVAEDLNLPPDWLNNGPSQGEGGLFQLGLPTGFETRLHKKVYGDRLTVHFAGRVDQVHFKLYAAVDRGGHHITDLYELAPSHKELLQAARWSMTHDTSEAFAEMLKRLLRSIGHGAVAGDL